MGVLEAATAALSGLSVFGRAFGWLKRRLGRRGKDEVPIGQAVDGHVESSAVAGRDRLFSLEQTAKGWRLVETAEQISTPAHTWSV